MRLCPLAPHTRRSASCDSTADQPREQRTGHDPDSGNNAMPLLQSVSLLLQFFPRIIEQALLQVRNLADLHRRSSGSRFATCSKSSVAQISLRSAPRVRARGARTRKSPWRPVSVAVCSWSSSSVFMGREYPRSGREALQHDWPFLGQLLFAVKHRSDLCIAQQLRFLLSCVRNTISISS